MDYTALIIDKYNELSSKECQLADYLIGNLQNVSDMDISELSVKAGVSVATVTRFTQHLGFSGYKEFRIRIAQNISQYDEFVLDFRGYEDNIEKKVSQVLNACAESIRDTLHGIDYKILQAAAKLIKQGEKILFCGVGTSGIVCADAALKFQRIGKLAFEACDIHKAAVYLSNFKKHDLVISVSHSGVTKEILDIMKIARSKGIGTIAITTYGTETIEQLADIILYSRTRESPKHKVAMTSRTSQYAVIDALFIASVGENYDRSLDNILEISDSINASLKD